MRNIAQFILIWLWVALYAALVGTAAHFYAGHVILTIVVSTLAAAWARYAVHTLEEMC